MTRSTHRMGKGLFDLDGQVAIVTGSTRGIGRAIAERMAEAGARVVISSRNADPCAVIANDINAQYGNDRAIGIAASLSDRGSLRDLVDKTTDHWGKLDALVCNAASNPYFGPMSGISDAQFRKVLDNNILANHWLIQDALPWLRTSGSASIIIVSSIGGLVGSPRLGAYNISKAADMQMVRNLAVELGPEKIRVNAIAPGLIKTDFSRALWEDPQTLSRYTDSVPLGRAGIPDDIAGVAVFLASRAGGFLTGQTLVVDGGSTIVGV
jgi:NAD(P)-dependent dehydrogenase (short-subunit alcohol dehydrogenase family)